MWAILEHRRLDKELATAPVHVRKKYEVWKTIVRHSGPEGLLKIHGFNDEALSGKWKGYRSSRLSLDYRVIYKIERQRLSVSVERVSKHDYRK
jgi:addiction module RelE/StbE family toxin